MKNGPLVVSSLGMVAHDIENFLCKSFFGL